MSPAEALRSLHARGELLVIPNAWDVASARLFEDGGARAVATSSAAVAWSLGHPDGERLPLDELAAAVRRMARALKVPLTVDLERGYGADAAGVAQAVEKIIDAGAAGINLEDGGGPARALVERIAAAKAVAARRGGLFVNARTCIVLHGLSTGDRVAVEVLERASAYASAGADGLFVPGLTNLDAIERIAKGTALPLNLLATRGLAGLPELKRRGVRRLTVGPRLFEVAYGAARTACESLLRHDDSSQLFASNVSYAALNALLSR